MRPISTPLLSIICLIVLLLWMGLRPAPAEPYIALNGGAAFLSPVNITVPGASSQAKSKLGYAAAGALGWRFNDYLAAEAEVGLIQSSFDSLSGAIEGPLVGRSTIITGFANALVTPAGRAQFRPVGGFGIGMANTAITVDEVAGVPLAISRNRISLALQGISGFDFSPAPNMNIGARYRYIWIGNKQSYDVQGIPVEQGNMTAHVVTLGGSLRF